MYRNLIFDFDGTIADSQDIVSEIFGELALRHKFDRFTQKEIKHKSDLPILKKIKILLFIKKIDCEFKDLYRDNIERIRPIDGIVDILKQLGQMGIVLSVISSNRRANIEAFFKLNGLSFITDIISTRGLHGKHKAIREYKMKHPEIGEAINIGDEIRDVRACKKANTDIAFVKWGLDGSEDISGLDLDIVLNEPSDLINLVR